MRRTAGSVALITLMAIGVWLVSNPSAQSAAAVQQGLAHFNANRSVYGLSSPTSDLVPRGSRRDSRGVTHVRLDQTYRGLRVFEGEAIAHVKDGGEVTVSNALRVGLNVDVSPRLSQNAAVATALGYVGPLGAYRVRAASLWILPRGERSVVDRLVWRVTIGVENEFEDPAEWQYFIDARDGSVAFSYNDLETSAAVGTGNTMYLGPQSLSTDFTGGKYYLRDLSHASSYTCDMNNKQGSCTVFSRSNNIFGNGSKANTDRATAGADAHYGLQATWEYYRSMFGRNGINGAGKRAYSRVHYGRNYENAYWSNSCFCMTYGDGATTFFPLVSLDVAGHEVSHGVMSTEANLTYSGESGGLNESNSDIFGTLVEHAVNSPQDVSDYWIGERIYRSNYNAAGVYTQTKALRYMDTPSKDNRSPNCYYSGIGGLDVHYSSGPNNHMFYLLSNGGTSACNGQTVVGVGRDKAARIWYKAIADYLTASSGYAAARVAALNAATALYGAGGSEYTAVAAAYAAIGVN